MRGVDSFDPRWRAVAEDGSDLPGDRHPPQVAVRTGQTVTNFVMAVHRPDGTLVWVSVNAVPLRDAEERAASPGPSPRSSTSPNAGRPNRSGPNC